MIRAQLDVNEARDALRCEIHRGVFKTVIDVSLGRISAGLHAAVGLRVSAWPAGLLLGAASLGICGAVAALAGRSEVLLAQLSLHVAPEAAVWFADARRRRSSAPRPFTR